MTTLATMPADWPGWQCVAPIPEPQWTPLAGRPWEFWELVTPLEVAESGRRHHARPMLLLGNDYGVPRAWRKQFLSRGEPDQGPRHTTLARQMFGRQPGYVARIGLDDVRNPDALILAGSDPESAAPVRELP